MLTTDRKGPRAAAGKLVRDRCKVQMGGDSGMNWGDNGEGVRS